MWFHVHAQENRRMQPRYLPAPAGHDAAGWQQTVMAFLAEKDRRSGSRRTVEGYARMLWPFLGGFESPAQVTPACPCLGPWDRAVGSRAIVSDRWSPDRLPRLLLPLPDPDAGRDCQPV
jgi:hypothetical protein